MLSKKARRLTKKLSMIPPPFFFYPLYKIYFWNAVILRLSYVKVTDKETYGGKLDKQLKKIIHSAITESLGLPLSPEKSPIILSLNKSLKCVYSCVFRLLTLFTECQACINGWKVYKEAWSKNWLYINRLLPKRPSLFLNSCLIIDKGIIPWCTQIEGGANYIHCFNWIIEWITNILFLLRGMHIKFLPNMQYGCKCW